MTIYAVFVGNPEPDELALAIFLIEGDAQRYASHVEGRTIQEWYVTNTDFMEYVPD